jgi:uncharacterized protein with PIN domain
MRCPKCGAEMNFHAEKIVYALAEEDEMCLHYGKLLEFHACPRCGASATRDSASQI